jgi:chitinase
LKWLKSSFFELKKEGLEPNTRAFAEMIGAYMQVGVIEKAMETYESMKASGCAPDRLTFMILIRNLEIEKAGKEEVVAMVKRNVLNMLILLRNSLNKSNRNM